MSDHAANFEPATAPYYVTTPIYYVNAKLHIGGAYTTLVADTLARYARSQGRPTFFLTGSDEHGQKIADTAREQGKEPLELADEIVPYFHELWETLEITHDRFIRTTDHYHERVVKSFFAKLRDNGYLTKGVYKALYCTGCEKPYSRAELEDGRLCPIHRTPVVEIEEDNYFIKLTALKEKLEAALREEPPRLLPPERRNKVLADLRDIEDQSVSRRKEKLTWGVHMPDDDEHVIWVWFDALINYVSGLLKEEVEARADAPDPLPFDELIQTERFQQFWPQVVHLIGKDILWHHTLIWWAMLLGVGLTPPKLVFAHGWWTVEGLKISKALGTGIDPALITRRFGNDPLRYYLLREMTFGNDGDFSVGHLVQRINADLGKGGLGNLVARTLNMVEKYREGVVPAVREDALTDADRALRRAVEENAVAFQRHVENYQPHLAIEDLWKIVRHASQYIDEQAPWKLGKAADDAAQQARLDNVLVHLCEACRVLGVALESVMPETAAKIAAKLGQPVRGATTHESAETPLRERVAWGGLAPGTRVEKGDNLFPAIRSALDLAVAFEGETATVSLDGFLETATAEELRAALADVREGLEPVLDPHAKKGASAKHKKPRNVRFDLAGLVYCSATGAKALADAKEAFASVDLVNVPDGLREVLSAYA